MKSMWKMNCEQLKCYDDKLAAKDEKIYRAERQKSQQWINSPVGCTGPTELLDQLPVI